MDDDREDLDMTTHDAAHPIVPGRGIAGLGLRGGITGPRMLAAALATPAAAITGGIGVIAVFRRAVARAAAVSAGTDGSRAELVNAASSARSLSRRRRRG